jgi:hypothetical protein
MQGSSELNAKNPNMAWSYEVCTSDQDHIVIVRGPFAGLFKDQADNKENIPSTTYVRFENIAAHILQLGVSENLNMKDLIQGVKQLCWEEKRSDKKKALEQVAYAILTKAASNSSNNLDDLVQDYYDTPLHKDEMKKLSEQDTHQDYKSFADVFRGMCDEQDPFSKFFNNKEEMLQQIREETREETREEPFTTTSQDLIIDQNYYTFSGQYDSSGKCCTWRFEDFQSFEDWQHQ